MKRKQLPKPQYYVVMDQNGLVFSGLQYGEPKWDANWSNAKPLELS